MLRQNLESPNLDVVLAAALQLAEGIALEPMKLLETADRLNGAQRVKDVATLYQRWLQHCHSSVNYIIQFNLGATLSQLGQIEAAEAAYRAAIAQNPEFAQAWFNLGTLLERQHKPQEALAIWQSMLDDRMVDATQSRELYLMTCNNLGRLYEETRQLQKSEAILRTSLDADPNQPKVIQHWVHLRQKQCVWPVYEPPAGLTRGDLLKASSPLALLAGSDDPGLQLAAAVHFVKERVNVRVPALASAQGYGHQKLRIGFLSSDFCLHAVSLLTVELFELIDRQRFEVYGFCWSREDGSALRERVRQAMDHFVRIDAMDDATAAQCIRNHEIDILIDLHGLTSGARPDIPAYRPAAVQMTYLGFPGSTGLPGIDYVIADRYLIPDSEKAYYSETPLYLAQIYQCSDRQRPVAALPTRAECGLPQERFVFCSFNNNYKFNEEVFDCWMRILQRAPDSVLWLLADNQWAQENLCARAQAHGVDPARLLFAPRVAPEQYLARYSVADLFLDAYPFNAGTTANDALWMGLPVLTRSGRTFASRMAGSLLTALDLPELITTTLAEYEERAVELATRADLLPGLRERLHRGREHSALFDTPRFVRDFEDAISSVAPGRV
ncbi:putative O-linked N-acetylglucosamine transferase, SPINDLY family [Pseudomonas sp. GM33]|uniref:O-linked N-acetylglucosamine transferase, SPINDLY family protein n=1 Tax=Pseudomonas sp. GM33 TaxID=1144329 RepID=UPI00026FE95B|nr:tetratricopeptide repeat protein [Pseudomonas sp. GM33]EJM39025.1 putative O-linked N-acetylglucosamine transferase, SPINDLY family [Pseudomonas sp. GM33]